MRERLRRLGVLLALILLLAGFHTVLVGADWWLTTVSVLVSMAVVGELLVTVAPRWAVPGMIVVWLLAIVWVFVPSTTFFGVPTPGSAAALVDLFESAGTVVVQEASPLDPPASVTLLLVAAFGPLLILAQLVLRTRYRVVALGALALSIYVTPALISGLTPSWWVFVPVAAAWLALLATRITPVAVVTGAIALVAALVLPSFAPTIDASANTWGKAPSQVFGQGINPMIELGSNLRRDNPVVVLRSSTTATEAPYLKVATLRDFTGRTWRPTPPSVRGPFEGFALIDGDIETSSVVTTIDIVNLRSSMLPLPYPATRINGLKGQWAGVREGNTMISAGEASSLGQNYQVESIDRDPTAEQMRDLTAGGDGAGEQYLELPDEMPEVIADTARERTADASSDYDRILALQTWLRQSFEYSETAPVAEGYDGNGVEVIATFLEEKAGYCVHFSSTLAVMARTLGIPSRVAVGYAPGSPTARLTADGNRIYETTSDQLHAWTEIYFDGMGWVPFDPTPGIGTATRFEEPADSTSGDLPSDRATPTAVPSTPARGLDEFQTTTAAQAEEETGWSSLGIAAAVVVLAAASPATVRRARRSARWRRGENSAEPLWSELSDTARDLGIGVTSTETPRAFAARLRAHGVDTEALTAVLVEVEGARYGRADVPRSSVVGEARRAVDSLERAAPTPHRVKARLLPRSILSRSLD